MKQLVLWIRRRSEFVLLAVLAVAFTSLDIYWSITGQFDPRQYVPFVIPVFLVIMMGIVWAIDQSRPRVISE